MNAVAANNANNNNNSAAATLFQRNKQLYVEEEARLEAVVCDTTYLQSFQAWLDGTVSQLDYLFGRCEVQLAELQQKVAVQTGDFWNSKTIIQYCNLHLSEKRLTKRGVPPSTGGGGGGSGKNANNSNNQSGRGSSSNNNNNNNMNSNDDDDDDAVPLAELVELIAVLQQVKSHSFVTPKQKRFIEQCEEELHHAAFDRRDLQFITRALRTKLNDDISARGVFGDLAAFQNSIEELAPDIDQCEHLLEAAIAKGEMGLAEDISRRQLDVYEHVLRLTTDQYPIIASHHAESRQSDRRRRWSIFRMANKDVSAVVEAKFRRTEACEEDLTKIREQVEHYNTDDLQQRKRYEADRGASDRFLEENKEKQQGVWNRIFALYQELQACGEELAGLAHVRRREVDRRLQLEEREAGRRSGHEAFLHAAAAHAKRLEDTIADATAARDMALALNNFVLDGCDTIAERYDQQQHGLGDMLRLVQTHHARRFTDYYIAASRYLYRKQRRLEQLDEQMAANDMQRELLLDQLDPSAQKYAQENQRLAVLRREVAQEVLYVKHRLERADRAAEPTLRALRQDAAAAGGDGAGGSVAAAGAAVAPAVVHPSEIVARMNANRWSTMLDYREELGTADVRVKATTNTVPAGAAAGAAAGGPEGAAARALAEEVASLRRAQAQLEAEGNVLSPDGTHIADPSHNTINSRRKVKPEAAAAAAARRREQQKLLEETGGGGAAEIEGGDAEVRLLLAPPATSTTTTATSPKPADAAASNDTNADGDATARPGDTFHRPAPPAQQQSAFARRVQQALDQQYRHQQQVNGSLVGTGGAPVTLPRIGGGAVSSSSAAAAARGSTSGSTVPTVGGAAGKGGVAAPSSSSSLPAAAANNNNNSNNASGGPFRSPGAGGVEGVCFRALYPYKARAPDELSFEAGALIVCVCAAAEEGWFKGICDQRTGLFPINYVEPADDGW